jgi:hypothetical protein
MAKRQASAVLERLAGKRLVFSGKFPWGTGDSLKAMAEAQQGKVLDDLDATVDYLVLANANAGKTIQKKALALNGKGAAIQVIDADAFCKLAEPTEAEILALVSIISDKNIAIPELPAWTGFWRRNCTGFPCGTIHRRLPGRSAPVFATAGRRWCSSRARTKPKR